MRPADLARYATSRRALQTTGVPAKVPSDLGEAGTKAPLFGHQALGEGHRFACGVIAEKRHNGSELGRHGSGFALLPIDVGVSGNAHPFGSLPLQKAKLTTSLLEVLAQGLGCFRIILWFLRLNGKRHALAKRHRTNATGTLWSIGSLPGFDSLATSQGVDVTRCANSCDHLDNALEHAAVAELVMGSHQPEPMRWP